MLQLLWCSDGATSTFALRAKMRECEVAKAKLRRCEGEGAKVRRCEGESAKAKERYYYRSFAHATSHSRLRNFAFVFFFIAFSMRYRSIPMESNLLQAPYSPEVCRLISDVIDTHAL